MKPTTNIEKVVTVKFIKPFFNFNELFPSNDRKGANGRYDHEFLSEVSNNRANDTKTTNTKRARVNNFATNQNHRDLNMSNGFNNNLNRSSVDHNDTMHYLKKTGGHNLHSNHHGLGRENGNGPLKSKEINRGSKSQDRGSAIINKPENTIGLKASNTITIGAGNKSTLAKSFDHTYAKKRNSYSHLNTVSTRITTNATHTNNGLAPAPAHGTETIQTQMQIGKIMGLEMGQGGNQSMPRHGKYQLEDFNNYMRSVKDGNANIGYKPPTVIGHELETPGSQKAGLNRQDLDYPLSGSKKNSKGIIIGNTSGQGFYTSQGNFNKGGQHLAKDDPRKNPNSSETEILTKKTLISYMQWLKKDATPDSTFDNRKDPRGGSTPLNFRQHLMARGKPFLLLSPNSY
jgi:hypothetical protein